MGCGPRLPGAGTLGFPRQVEPGLEPWVSPGRSSPGDAGAVPRSHCNIWLRVFVSQDEAGVSKPGQAVDIDRRTKVSFTQIITVEGADEQALHDHVAQWDEEQAGVAPGYLGARVLSDSEGKRHIIEVDFTSEEEARRNNDRPETGAWAQKLQEMGTGQPDYRDLRLVCTTYSTS